jgi:hypothetical protein
MMLPELPRDLLVDVLSRVLPAACLRSALCSCRELRALRGDVQLQERWLVRRHWRLEGALKSAVVDGGSAELVRRLLARRQRPRGPPPPRYGTGGASEFRQFSLLHNPGPACISDRALTALLHAVPVARFGHGDVLRLLIHAGADPSHSDGFDTPLHQACAFGNAGAAAALLGAGADADARNRHGHTPLALAIATMHLDLVKLF